MKGIKDAATRAIDRLIEQGIFDPFQQYNAAQVIRQEYKAESARLDALRELERKWRKDQEDTNELYCADELAKALTADEPTY